MIIAGMVLLTILAFLLINFFSDPGANPGGDNAGTSKQALIEEIEELESSIVELEVVFQTIQFEDDMSKELLEEKRDEIRSFDQKVKEQRKKIDDLQAKVDAAKRRGDVDKETIAKLQASIDKAEEKQIKLENDFTKQEIEFLYMENRKLTAFNDSLQRLKPDSLMLLLGDLKAQLRDCGNGSSPVLTERGTEIDEAMVQEAITELTSNTSVADLLVYNRSKKGDDLIGSSYKGKDLKTIILKYNIKDENLKKLLDGAEMYLVVTDVHGQEITSDNDLPSLKKCDNKECVIAAEARFKSGEGLTFTFVPEGVKWERGTVYSFKIYIDGKRIRRKNILIS